MTITPEEIKQRVERLTFCRMRKLLLRACQGGYLTDELIATTMDSGFWRSFGYVRLTDYLQQELRLPEGRASALALQALRRGYERVESYGLTEADIFPAGKKPA
jgi:hypothetical protein